MESKKDGEGPQGHGSFVRGYELAMICLKTVISSLQQNQYWQSVLKS